MNFTKMMILMILMTLMIPRIWTWPHEFSTHDAVDDFDDFDESSYMDLAK